MTADEIMNWLEEEGVVEIGLRPPSGGGWTHILHFSGTGNLREALTERIEAIQRERER